MVHGVPRCNHRECRFTTSEDFALRIARLRQLLRTSVVTLSASCLMATPLLLPAPTQILEDLGRFTDRASDEGTSDEGT